MDDPARSLSTRAVSPARPAAGLAATAVPQTTAALADAPAAGSTRPPELEVVIEVPRFSFLKRGADGSIDFVSPLPCPYNYGAVPTYLGQEGDLLDALVLGPRLRLGTRLRVSVWGAVRFEDRGMPDDKLVCGSRPPRTAERQQLLRFFAFYARCKGLLNAWRHRPGRNACDGWCEASEAIARARPLTADWRRAPVPF